ncbi:MULTISPECIES: hypothetical protein [unclassified Brachybacterium]|uniref:hypothetical protein n=1 Tax=unclassified Brachybacterium TaxID=2623841 RepID=UPI003614DD6B
MTQQTLRTERDAAGAYEILAAASSEAEVLAVLTDEELIALRGNQALDPAGTPFLDASGLDRDPAAAVALRSLTARGLVQFTDEGRENEGEDLATEAPAERTAQLDRTLAGLLTLRSAPLALVNLTRRVADQTTEIIVYVFPHDGVLEEFVTVDGFHHFSVPTREALPARLARYVDQNSVAGDEDGEPIDGTLSDFEGTDSDIARRLQDTRALSVLTTADRGPDSVQVSIMATSDAVFVMDTPQDETSSTALREVSADTLVDLLGTALPEAAAL